MRPDPVLVHGAAGMVALVFLAGAADKLRQREFFAGIVQAYGLLPVPAVAVFALGVALAELGIGLALWAPAMRPAAPLAGLALLAVVTAAVSVNLLRGRTDLDCGCGGASGDQTLSWALVVRNGILAGVLAIAALPAAARGLNWLDLAMIGFVSVGGFGLYAAANQLLANAPRLARFGTA